MLEPVARWVGRACHLKANEAQIVCLYNRGNRLLQDASGATYLCKTFSLLQGGGARICKVDILWQIVLGPFAQHVRK